MREYKIKVIIIVFNHIEPIGFFAQLISSFTKRLVPAVAGGTVVPSGEGFEPYFSASIPPEHESFIGIN
jgi:hypothetical protein